MCASICLVSVFLSWDLAWFGAVSVAPVSTDYWQSCLYARGTALPCVWRSMASRRSHSSARCATWHAVLSAVRQACVLSVFGLFWKALCNPDDNFEGSEHERNQARTCSALRVGHRAA